MLDPAGDAKHTGRHIDDLFERGITLQCAEKIKDIIEQRCPSVKVFLTRLPGDIVYDLQNAAFANRLNANLFVSINFYHTNEARPTLFLYTFSYADTFVHHSDTLAFHSYDTAHITHKDMTMLMTKTIMHELRKDQYQTLFSCSGPHALPTKQIIGICCPSMVIDAGLKDKLSWIYYTQPIADAIITALKQ